MSPDPRRVTGRDVLWVVVAMIAFAILAVVLLTFVYALSVILGVEWAPNQFGPSLFAIEAAVIAAAVWLVMVRRRGFAWRDLGWVPVPAPWLALGAVLALAMLIVLLVLELLHAQVTGSGRIPTMLDIIPMFPPTIPGLLAAVALGAVAVPVAEEFLFRGVVYRWMRGRWGVAGGTVVTSLVFALLHPPGWVETPQIFLIGLLLAWLYERSGSLWPSMVLHGVNNAAGIVVIYAVLWSGTT